MHTVLRQASRIHQISLFSRSNVYILRTVIAKFGYKVQNTDIEIFFFQVKNNIKSYFGLIGISQQ